MKDYKDKIGGNIEEEEKEGFQQQYEYADIKQDLSQLDEINKGFSSSAKLDDLEKIIVELRNRKYKKAESKASNSKKDLLEDLLLKLENQCNNYKKKEISLDTFKKEFKELIFKDLKLFEKHRNLFSAFLNKNKPKTYQRLHELLLKVDKLNENETIIIEIMQQIRSNQSKNSSQDQLSKIISLNVANKPYMYGKGIFNEIANLIKNAEFEILMSHYKITDNQTWQLILNSLDELNQSTDKEVKLLIRVNRHSLAGEKFKPFGSAKSALSKLLDKDWKNIKITLYANRSEGLGFGSQHSKFIVVDKKNALISSADPCEDNDYLEKDEGQFEMAIKLNGDLSQLADNFYNSVRLLSEYTPNKRLPNQSEQQRLMNSEAEITQPVNKPEKIISQSDVLDNVIEKNGEQSLIRQDHIMDAVQQDFTPADAMFLFKDNKGIMSKHYKEYNAPAKTAILKLINNLKSPITIVTPNLNDKEIINAIAEQAACGREITIYLPRHRNRTAENLHGGDNIKKMEELKAAILAKSSNNEIPSTFNLRWTKDSEGKHGTYKQVFSKNPHAKYFQTGNYMIIGSTNLDQQSMYYSAETDVLINNDKLPEQYTNEINQNFAGKYFDDNNALEIFKSDLLDKLDNQLAKLNSASNQYYLLNNVMIQINNADCETLKKVLDTDLAALDFVDKKLQNKAQIRFQLLTEKLAEEIDFKKTMFSISSEIEEIKHKIREVHAELESYIKEAKSFEAYLSPEQVAWVKETINQYKTQLKDLEEFKSLGSLKLELKDYEKEFQAFKRDISPEQLVCVKEKIKQYEVQIQDLSSKISKSKLKEWQHVIPRITQEYKHKIEEVKAPQPENNNTESSPKFKK